MIPRLFEIPLPFEVFGVDRLPINTFGLMVAVAFFVAAWLLGLELERLYRAGRVPAVKVPAEEDNRKKKGRRGRTRMVTASPAVLVQDLIVIALVGGFLGARFFHILENLDQFGRDPLGMIFSTGGFTFYGGLIVAALAIAVFVRRKGLPVGRVADAVAPGLMIGYGIGRIGCYLSGDGDWGVCSYLENKPGWIPGWLWSENFENSVLGRPATVIENCPPAADGVFPTMLYEFAMAAALFGILWALRKHPFKAGWLFGLYLVFVGVERFIIEQIRVNNVFEVFGLAVTQAEVISVLMILIGGAVMVARRRRAEPAEPLPSPEAA